jgi:hypothetical protein
MNCKHCGEGIKRNQATEGALFFSPARAAYGNYSTECISGPNYGKAHAAPDAGGE